MVGQVINSFYRVFDFGAEKDGQYEQKNSSIEHMLVLFLLLPIMTIHSRTIVPELQGYQYVLFS